MQEKIVQKKILEALLKTFQEVPFLQISIGRASPEYDNGNPPDVVLEADMADGRRTKLLLETRSIGQPRQVREAINGLLRFTSGQSGFYAVIGAPYISPAAAKLCEQEGVGYIDLAGNCRLVFDTVYILREGAKNPFSEKRDLRSLYSPRATRVLRVLLNNPRTSWKTLPLANEAEVSVGQVANVKKLLRDREWIVEGKEGFGLKSPSDLLSEWSDNYSFRKNEVRDYYCMASMSDIEKNLAEACAEKAVTFALTGPSGAARIQPGIRYQRTMAFVSEANEELLKEIGLKQVDSGANVTLLIPYDEGVFHGTEIFDEIPVVSPVQLYLDLKSYRGRGEESAQIIYDKVLAKSW